MAEQKKKDFIEELTWRGMLHTSMPGIEDLFKEGMVTAYVGTDPTADSLHIGHLVSIMMLKHLQECGHKPLMLVGGATGMIGDPSGKSDERNLLDEATLRHNQDAIKKQLSRFLDFDSDAPNAAEMVNNYDWMKDFTFLDFAREIGKHITVNYMMAKDSVKSRLNGTANDGLSFTEFTYQLLQGYDFLHLYKNKNCRLQMGGSDQWGNITTGAELIRRKVGGDAYGLTCPLITKADGRKFGKTEKGNIWLDAARTSPYEFYQFWLNTSDSDAERYIKIFTLLDKQTVEELVKKHAEAPHLRLLQSRLAEEVTTMVHSREDYLAAVEASQILFGNATKDNLLKISEENLLAVFDGVPSGEMDAEFFNQGVDIASLLVKSGFLPSMSEARRALKENSISVNKEKTGEAFVASAADLIKGKYIVLQRGKKNYFLLKVLSPEKK